MIHYERDLHIVSFNVPYPANYGGVIDVFYKIKALTEQGIRVHLHCFQYGRAAAPILEKLCHKVYYYKRRLYKDPFFTKQPYIVATRNSPELLQNLLKDDFPILFEGIHCCYFLSHPALRYRCTIVRMHNIEFLYYMNLAKIERNVFKRYFFSIEAERLKKFEKELDHATAIAAISPEDKRTLDTRHDNVFYLPVFHANEKITAQPGFGNYALYHGNLGVGENNEAALFLVNEVFNMLKYPLIIAGMNPSRELRNAVEGMPHVQLVSKIDTNGIEELIQDAHINILPTFQSTGIKLKLINVLYRGRHCIVNKKMVTNTGLEPLCHVANTAERMQDAVKKLLQLSFTESEIEKRKSVLSEQFNNEESARLLVEHAYLAKLV